MEVKIIDQVGCTIEGDFKTAELEKFKSIGWRVVWFRDVDKSIRYPKTDDPEVLELQKNDFEELSKKGNTSCITDLFINAGM
jgi:hypothetical protein